MTPREAAILNSASILYASILARPTAYPLSVEDVIRARWAAEDTARIMAEEIAPSEPEPDPSFPIHIQTWILSTRDDRPLIESIDDLVLREALNLTAGNKKEAAGLLRMNRTTFLERDRRRRLRDERLKRC